MIADGSHGDVGLHNPHWLLMLAALIRASQMLVVLSSSVCLSVNVVGYLLPN